MLYYVVLPWIYLVSILPFRMLYGLSDGMFFIVYHVLKYRRAVVEINLRSSFPDKNPVEIQALSKAYFRYMCDLMLETFKTLTISRKSALKHCRFHDTSLLNELYTQGRSIIIVLGHYGNWEWAGSSMSLDTRYQLYVIYHPLSNKKFDRLIYRMRTRFGTKLISMKNTLRDMIKNKNEINATAFIADQTPQPDHAYWTTFLNQETPVFEGPEKVARLTRYPVVYATVKRVKRGYYEIFTDLLVDKTAETTQGEILDLFTARLEKDIHEQPEIWLWSHRRWKHKRTPVNN